MLSDGVIDLARARVIANGTAHLDLVNADQPTCAFPGCRVPAEDCDYDHLLPVIQGGETSRRNGGPKCRHDHILKDKQWKHQRINGRDTWTSPLGHTYTTEKPP